VPETPWPPPRYLQIAAHYRELIANGELASGDALPSARELARRWNVAKGTAERVLGTLRSEGLTVSRGGRAGTLVNASLPGRPDRVRRWARIVPTSEHAHVVYADLVPASDAIADIFGVAARSPVIARHQVTIDRDVPVAESTSWFPGDLAVTAPALLTTAPITGGAPGYIEARTGRRVATTREQLTAGLATDATAVVLGITAGDPVLVGRSWLYDDRDTLIEFHEYTSVNTRSATYEAALGASRPGGDTR
jgi:DNA-binding GntR family transcriptional regulator